MELSCKCGNEYDFTERTTVEFIVDGEGNRQEKLIEDTVYICDNCNADAEVCE